MIADKIRPQQTLIGFDFGLRRIGVAVGQAITATATPLETVRANEGKPDWATISRLISDWHVDALVVGLPLNMDGSEQDMTRAARRFANQLKGRYHLPVYLADERLSSVAAEEILNNPVSGRRRTTKKQADVLDQVAAQLILMTFFQQQDQHELE